MRNIALKQKEILLKYSIFEREEELEELLSDHGPKRLCEHLGIDSLNNPEFEHIFDYFVIERNFLARLVKRYLNHFKELYEEHGPTDVRKLLWIDKGKYNAIWRPIHDLIGIAEGALLNYVYNNRFSLSRRLHVFGGDDLREYLEMKGKNYAETWRQVLDILLQTVTAGYFNERIFDDAMKVFVLAMNDRRQHVSLKKPVRV